MRRFATPLLLLAATAALVAAIVTRSRIGHPVTARMRTSAQQAAGHVASPLPGHAWGRPTVLVFIQDGCPCSEAAEPYFRSLVEAYGPEVSFLGVIDGDSSVASRWRQDHQTPYPVLADPDLSLIRHYGAQRSAYSALISREGRIERLWPGFSADMLRELGARLAEARGIAEVKLAHEEAPARLTSGCPFPIEFAITPASP